MDPQIATALIAVVPTLGGIIFTWWKFRKSQISHDSNASYDQIQEDLKAMREERARDRDAAIAERGKDRKEMAYLQGLVLHLDNEVVKLREEVQAGHIPPLAPREPWPQRGSAV